jgi:hypothetical protein
MYNDFYSLQITNMEKVKTQSILEVTVNKMA